MTRLPHPASVWVANLLVPGAGFVLLGRLVMGILVAAAWGLTAGGWLLLVLVWPGGGGGRAAAGLAVVLGLLAAGVYVASQVLLYSAFRFAKRYLYSRGRDEMFKSALTAYLQGRYEESESACKALLRFERDDVEAALQLAAIARRRGDGRSAQRYLRRARYLDDEGLWDFEIEREQAVWAGMKRPKAI